MRGRARSARCEMRQRGIELHCKIGDTPENEVALTGKKRKALASTVGRGTVGWKVRIPESLNNLFTYL